jgi:hypothetical protein
MWLQRALSQRMQQLQVDLTKRQQMYNAEQDENERLRAENAAKESQMAVLQAKLREVQISHLRDPVPDQSMASSAGSSRRTPRVAPPRTPEVARDAFTPPGPMTAEEKHIRRMRYVMARKESDSGLPRRCASSFCQYSASWTYSSAMYSLHLAAGAFCALGLPHLAVAIHRTITHVHVTHFASHAQD